MCASLAAMENGEANDDTTIRMSFKDKSVFSDGSDIFKYRKECALAKYHQETKSRAAAYFQDNSCNACAAAYAIFQIPGFDDTSFLSFHSLLNKILVYLEKRGEIVILPVPKDISITYLQWHPQSFINNSLLAYLAEEFNVGGAFCKSFNTSQLSIVDTSTKNIVLVKNFSGIARLCRWRPDGKQMAVWVEKDGKGTIQILDIINKEETFKSKYVLEIPVPGLKIRDICYFPHNILAVLCSGGKIFFFNSTGKKIYDISSSLSFTESMGCGYSFYWYEDDKHNKKFHLIVFDGTKGENWVFAFKKNFEIAKTKFEYKPQEKAKKPYTFCVDQSDEWFL